MVEVKGESDVVIGLEDKGGSHQPRNTAGFEKLEKGRKHNLP